MPNKYLKSLMFRFMFTIGLCTEISDFFNLKDCNHERFKQSVNTKRQKHQYLSV